MSTKTLSILASLTLVAGLIPGIASAHEQQKFTIGDKQYLFVIGSLNEPVVVDDKTGVDISIQQIGLPPKAGTRSEKRTDGSHEEAGVPITGLEKTLKVELLAGDKKRTLDLAPQYGAPGKYKAVFFPTIETTYTYRVFGTINEVPVNLSFACNPTGHAKAPEDTESKSISEGVTRTFKTGAFGCPLSKSDLGFPESASTLNALTETANSESTTRMISIAGIALSLFALFKARRQA